MSIEVSARALFAEQACSGPGCTMLVPDGVRLCRSCLVKERRADGQTGAGHPPRGRFEARVRHALLFARALDTAEASHRGDPSAETHAMVLKAFRAYRQAVRLLDQA